MRFPERRVVRGPAPPSSLEGEPAVSLQSSAVSLSDEAMDIEGHPVVIRLRAENERLKAENLARCEDYMKAVQAKMALQNQLFDLQGRPAAYKDQMTTICDSLRSLA
jgi:hypothetical protein